MTNKFVLRPVYQKNDASFQRKMMFFSNAYIRRSSVAKDPKTNIFVFPAERVKGLNLDLRVISRSACQWKMLFNTDPKKPAHEVIFSWKKNEETHPSVFYDNIKVSRTDSQKHLGLVLDKKLTFKKTY